MLRGTTMIRWTYSSGSGRQRVAARRQRCAASSWPACAGEPATLPCFRRCFWPGCSFRQSSDAYVQFYSGEAREVKKRTDNHLYALSNCLPRVPRVSVQSGRALWRWHVIARVFMLNMAPPPSTDSGRGRPRGRAVQEQGAVREGCCGGGVNPVLTPCRKRC
jgi:hypothetical protein